MADKIQESSAPRYEKDEIVDITSSSKDLLCRLAVMKEDKYQPHPRPETETTVYRRTGAARALITQQDVVISRLKSAERGLDQLDQEVEELRREMKDRQIRYSFRKDTERVQYEPKYKHYSLKRLVTC